MTFILSKNIKPKLVDNIILNQITKQNLLNQQFINVESEKSKYQILLNTFQNKCIDYLTNYYWIILIIIIIIIILWFRYKWYKKSLEKNDQEYIYEEDIQEVQIPPSKGGVINFESD